MQRAHRHFTKSQRKHAKALHKQQKRNQPRMYAENRNNLIRAIVNSEEVNLNISKVDIVV